MKNTHFDETELARFIAGTAPREDVRRAVVHLLRGCPICTAALRERAQPRPASSADYDRIFNRLAARLAIDDAWSRFVRARTNAILGRDAD